MTRLLTDSQCLEINYVEIYPLESRILRFGVNFRTPDMTPRSDFVRQISPDRKSRQPVKRRVVVSPRRTVDHPAAGPETLGKT